MQPHLATLHNSPDQRPRGAASKGSALRHQRVEEEMNRFHGALRSARHELRDARRGATCVGAEEIEAALSEEDALLRDSLVLLEVERTILDERRLTEDALTKVLDERLRLARLVGGEPAMAESAHLARAFERVSGALAKARGAE